MADRTLRIPAQLAPDRVASVAALREAGISAAMVTSRCRRGVWRRILPGVVLLDGERPTRRQRVRAAACYTAPFGAVTGLDALELHGVPLVPHGMVRILLPVERRSGSRWFMHVERTCRMPVVSEVDGIMVAHPARAAVDAARSVRAADDVRNVLVEPVMRGLCTRQDYVDELAECNQRGSAAVRSAVRNLDYEVAGAVRGVAADVIGNAPFPPVRWHAVIRAPAGRQIGYADAWWEAACLAWLIEGPHPTLPRMRDEMALRAAGVTVVRTPMSEVARAASDDLARARLLRELSNAMVMGARRAMPRVEVHCGQIPAAA